MLTKEQVAAAIADQDKDRLMASLERLITWREAMADDRVIDAESGLAADDLDILLAHLIRTRNVVSIRRIDMGNLPPDLLEGLGKNGPTSARPV